jgi:TPR repeat protein
MKWWIRAECLACAVVLAGCGGNAQPDKMGAALKAAEQHYYKGEFAQAAPLFQALAERGDVQAEFFIGGMYLAGTGVPRDYAAALKWSRMAAEHGSTAAQFNLGKMYELGEGVPQDYVQAHMWFSLSASSGDEQATRMRDAMAQKMTYDQIQQARRQARAWQDQHHPQ